MLEWVIRKWARYKRVSRKMIRAMAKQMYDPGRETYATPLIPNITAVAQSCISYLVLCTQILLWDPPSSMTYTSFLLQPASTSRQWYRLSSLSTELHLVRPRIWAQALHYISWLAVTTNAEIKQTSLKKSRLFSVLVPQWWNEFPTNVRTAELLTIFRLTCSDFTSTLHKHDSLPGWLKYLVVVENEMDRLLCFSLSAENSLPSPLSPSPLKVPFPYQQRKQMRLQIIIYSWLQTGWSSLCSVILGSHQGRKSCFIVGGDNKQ